MTYRAVIFDLDGTLLDTLEDIAVAANRVLAARGFATHPVDAYRYFVGDGSAVLMERALPGAQRSAGRIRDCLAAFLADYDRNWNQATRPYDGIPALLAYLAEHDLSVAVVTNKPHHFACLTLDYYFAATDFRFVSGLKDGIARKPDPAQALAAAAAMGVDPADCIFLGDSAVDMQTGVRAGMLPIGAGWGFRTAAELLQAGAARVIAHPLELISMLHPSGGDAS